MSLPTSGKLLALDLGKNRTGIAITDEAQTVAFKRPEFEHQNLSQLLDFLDDLNKQENLAGILVGLPLNMQGQDSNQTTWTRQVIETLKTQLKIPILAVDERWTTHHAKSRTPDQKHVDSESARILLEPLLH